ncbi:hypothetical protein HJFPF1_11633 [Paramyrothecium foliicola]|nr:hypothetical protein HJFPF1_11633 [Paramyrothecium foliicola]
MLGGEAGFNVTMATPASQTANAAPKKMTMKRSNSSPWTARALGGRKSMAQTPLQRQTASEALDPGPANIVSDVLPSTESTTPTPPPLTKPSLATNAKILSAQARWERSQGEAVQRASRSTSTSTDDSLSSDASSVAAVMPAGVTPANSSQPRQTLPDLKPTSSALSRTMRRKQAEDAAGPDAKRQRASERTSSPADQLHRDSGVGRQQALHEAKALAEEQLSSVQSEAHVMKHKTGAELVAHVRKSLAQSSPMEASQSPASDDVSFKAPQARVTPIAKAPDGRQYDQFIDADGRSHFQTSAIFPVGYKENDQSPYFSCPVTGCKAAFDRPISLRGHQCASHRGITFEDNGDGTITKVGTYKNTDGPSPPIVVSISATAVAAAGAVKNRVSGAAAGSKKPETPVPLPLPLQGPRPVSDPMTYLSSVSAPGQHVPQRPDILWMVKLPKQRDLPISWLHQHRGEKLDGTTYAIALAFITGKEVTGQERCTQVASLSTARLSKPCVAPPSLPGMLLEHFSKTPTCVGCKYWSILQRQTNRCDWARGQPSQTSAETTAESTDDGLDMRKSRGRPRRVQAEPILIRDEPAPPAVRVNEAMSAAGRAASQLEMEEWEFAPGRRMDSSSNETIAISSAYQTANHPIEVSEDVGINDIVIERGRSHQWHAEKDKLRICYVASGKVLVKMGDETFRQGPNSSLIIRPGKTCTVENRFYVDAVVHCTTIHDHQVVDEDV